MARHDSFRLRMLFVCAGIAAGGAVSCSPSNGDISGVLVKPPVGTVPAAGETGAVPPELASRLANEFAPILFYDKDEPNLPVSVDRFLAKTTLRFYDRNCRPADVPAANLNGSQIPRMMLPGCAHPAAIDSFGTRSAGKNATFYLPNVPETEQRGSLDSERWTTYLHAYHNDKGGISLQFWRFYPYNTAYFLGLRSSAGSHGGDWEAIHVVLQPARLPKQGPPVYEPAQIVLLGHTQLASYPWQAVITEANHPLIRCEKGGHTSMLMTRRDLKTRDHFIEQQSWTGGAVRWPDNRITRSGPLIDLGSKTHPAAGAEWLGYSGLWGTRESGILGYYRSGYWGPAFNETGMRADGFVSAWCEGMARPRDMREGAALRSECYPASSIP